MKKYILNKILILIIFLLNTFNFFADDFVDSVNIRKSFFSNPQWENYSWQIIKTVDRGKKYYILYNVDNENYEILFYSPIDNNLKEKHIYGAFSYQFNKDKELLSAKIYFHNFHDSYLLFEKNNPGRFDIYLFGELYRKNLYYYFPIDSLKFLSFNSIMSLLDTNKVKEKITIDITDEELKINFIKTIINPALSFKYYIDGAKDQFGQFVNISDESTQDKKNEGLNCSGFVKEIADNYIRLKIKDFKWMSIKELKKRRLDERENISYRYKEIEYDPFFGYDWAKNIADQINKYYNYQYAKAEEYNKDIFRQYTRLRGYDTKDLLNIIFQDQQNDSTYFYILVFSRLRVNEPVIPETYHLALAVPYFKNHHFYIRIFESCEETDFNNINKYRSNDKALIIKVPIPIEYF